MLDTILISLGLLALIILIGVIGRKFTALRQLKNMPTTQISHEIRRKEQLMTQRLERKFSIVGTLGKKYGIPAARLAGKGLKALYAKIVELENQYRHRSSLAIQADGENGSETNPEIFRLANEANEFLNAENYAEAEKRLISLISLDPTNISGYRKLADLYLETKDYTHAKETIAFIIGLEKKTQEEKEIIDGTDNIQLASDHIDLGIVCRELGQMNEAVQNIEQAARLDPNNPKNLDLLLEISLASKNKVLAWEAYDRLKEANPENQKLTEFEERIKEMERASELPKTVI